MGTTSEKLTYLNTTKTLIKEELNLGGANITNEPFREYKGKLEGIYKDFLANGTDTLWNNWEKVSGSGTEITLNNTIEAKMDFVYKGNTSQYSTTGKNLNYLQNLKWITNSSGEVVTNNSYWNAIIDTTNNNSIYISGNYSLLSDGVLRIGLYSSYPQLGSQGTRVTYSGNSALDTTNCNYVLLCYGTSSGHTIEEVQNSFMVSYGTTMQPYEPYTGGIPSPNPDYPQDIQVVSGDNTIKVEGKNLFDTTKYNSNGKVTVLDNEDGVLELQGVSGWYEGVNQEFDVIPNQHYILSYNAQKINTNAGIIVIVKEEDNITELGRNNNTGVQTISFTPTTGKINVFFRANFETNTGHTKYSNIQLELGNQSSQYTPYQGQTYSINLGNIELCKIGDYQDKIAKSTGKNLFDKTSSTVNKYLNSSDGSLINSSTSSTSDYIDIKSSTTYIISGYGTSNYYKVVAYYNSSKTFISANTVTDAINTYSITTPNNAKYLRFHYTTANESQIILNEGTTALPYEPYGKVWYLNKQIGKVVLDGSENWQNQFGESLFGTNLTDKKINANSLSYCNYFNFHNIQSGLNTNLLNGEYTIQIGTTDTFYCKNTNYSNTTDFKTWLNTHNTDVYYVLATPTITEITDTTLISQLEAIKKSYNTQTNISQENNDLPFELDVVALGELEI